MHSELLTVEETARRLKINPQTVRRWIQRGLLPAAKVGRKEWRIRAEDLAPRTAESSRDAARQRTRGLEGILALREGLRGRGLSVSELLSESRKELERRGARGRR